jgi:hypothetical protein
MSVKEKEGAPGYRRLLVAEKAGVVVSGWRRVPGSKGTPARPGDGGDCLATFDQLGVHAIL